MTDVIDMLKLINNDILSPKNKFVYYKKSGEIVKISNRKEDDIELEFLEVDKLLVIDILEGSRLLSDFRVEYSLPLKSKTLIEATAYSALVSSSDKVYKIPKINSNDIIDLHICEDRIQNKWIFTIDKSFLNMLDIEQYKSKTLLFSITSNNDPNILYKTIQVSLFDLLNQSSLFFDFQEQFELDDTSVSIYTPKYFNNYIHEIIK